VLVKAAGSGNAQVVQALLAAGADPAQRGELSRLPHEEAEHLGHADVAKLLRAALDGKRWARKNTKAPRRLPRGSSLLPNSSSSKNFATCVVVDFAVARRRRTSARGRTGLGGLERAAEWQRQLDCGAVASRAAIARREGLSRARVTQLLKRLAGTLDGKRRASAG
jgi:hypothetical protein